MLRRQTRKPEEGPVYLTKEGHARMKDRLERLQRSIPELAAEAERMAAQGDRSENDGYKEAKSILRRAHRQIWSIEDRLKRVVVIDEGPNASGTVKIGSTVVVDLKDGEKRTFRILGPLETNPSGGRISFESPLGKALMGHAAGETVIIATENGKREYTIIEVR